MMPKCSRRRKNESETVLMYWSSIPKYDEHLKLSRSLFPLDLTTGIIPGSTSYPTKECVRVEERNSFKYIYIYLGYAKTTDASFFLYTCTFTFEYGT